MKRSAILVAGFVAVVLAWNLTKAPAQVPNAPAPKWEYKVVTGEPSEPRLNQLGDEGWELVTASAKVSGGTMTNGTGSGISTQVRLVFKRAKR